MPLTSSHHCSLLPSPWWGVAAIALTLASVPAASASAEESPANPHAAHLHSHSSHHSPPLHRPSHHPAHHVGHPRPSGHSGAHPVANTGPQAAPPAVAAPLPPVNVGSNTGLPLPRFASLRADEVNMRSGPGTRYPILWLYKRRDLPVRIEREFDVWRLVEDSDGVKGWVHQATLTGTRNFVVIGPGSVNGPEGPAVGSSTVSGAGTGALLRDDPSDDAAVVAILRPGVIGRLRACPTGSDWCRVTARSYGGWLRRSAIFGLLPNEAIARP